MLLREEWTGKLTIMFSCGCTVEIHYIVESHIITHSEPDTFCEIMSAKQCDNCVRLTDKICEQLAELLEEHLPFSYEFFRDNNEYYIEQSLDSFLLCSSLE